MKQRLQLINSYLTLQQNILIPKAMKTIFYTPKEIIERNPILSRAKWTAQSIGYLFKLQLVRGQKTSRVNLIDENDVMKLFYFSFPEYLH